MELLVRGHEEIRNNRVSRHRDLDPDGVHASSFGIKQALKKKLAKKKSRDEAKENIPVPRTVEVTSEAAEPGGMRKPPLTMMPVTKEPQPARMDPSKLRLQPDYKQQSYIIHDLSITHRKLEQDNQRLREELEQAKATIRKLAKGKEGKDAYKSKYHERVSSTIGEVAEKSTTKSNRFWGSRQQHPRNTLSDSFVNPVGKAFAFVQSSDGTRTEDDSVARKNRRHKSVKAERQAMHRNAHRRRARSTARRSERHSTSSFFAKKAGYLTDSTAYSSSSQLV
jgi:hypothetical protein